MPMTPPALEQTAITPGDWLPGYEMQEPVGAGGFGTVYNCGNSARQDCRGQSRLSRPGDAPALAARFENEAVTLGRLHHPNIVQVYDYGFHAGRMYIVMELLDGEDLGVRLKRGGKLSEQVAWAVARQAASALVHAAGQGVIHRDVKPPVSSWRRPRPASACRRACHWSRSPISVWPGQNGPSIPTTARSPHPGPCSARRSTWRRSNTAAKPTRIIGPTFTPWAKPSSTHSPVIRHSLATTSGT